MAFSDGFYRYFLGNDYGKTNFREEICTPLSGQLKEYNVHRQGHINLELNRLQRRKFWSFYPENGPDDHSSGSFNLFLNNLIMKLQNISEAQSEDNKQKERE